MSDTLINRFNRLLFQGRYEQAYDSLRDSLREQTPQARIVSALVTIADRVGATEQALSLAERCLQRDRLDVADKTELLFSLAVLYDSLGQYDLAFDTCAEANRLKNRKYDLATDLFLFEETKKVYTSPDRLPLASASRSDDDQIFIVGMPRSGTSLLEQVLDMHSELEGMGELDAINHLAWSSPSAAGSELPYPYVLPYLDSAVLDAIAVAYRTSRPADGGGGKRRLIDKMPHNYHYLGFVRQVMPQAPILHTRRHPLDTCLSIYFRDFSGRHDYAYDLRDIGHKYILYLAWMDLWQRQLEMDIMDVPYEEWMQHPREVLTRVLDYLRLPWQEALLQHHTSSREVVTASYKQVREALHQRACQRWRNYESRLGPLLEILQPIL